MFGVQATDYVNSNVTAGVLSNNSSTARLRSVLSPWIPRTDAATAVMTVALRPVFVRLYRSILR